MVLHLIDSYSLTMPTLYISTLLLALRSMLQMDLPHLNVLTKIDNLATYPPLPLPLSFYTEARSLDHILPYLEGEQGAGASHDSQRSDKQHGASKFAALNEAIVELVEDYGLVGFETLAVEDRASMIQLLHTIDRAGGYAFGAAEGVNETVWGLAVREGGSGKMEVRDIEERWIERREEFDEMERQMWQEEAKADKRKRGIDVDNATATDAMDIDSGASPQQQQQQQRSPASGIKVVRNAAAQD